MILFLGLFLIEGAIGLGLWAGGAPFWSASGPVIAQGFGCAAALGWNMWTMHLDHLEQRRELAERLKRYGITHL